MVKFRLLLSVFLMGLLLLAATAQAAQLTVLPSRTQLSIDESLQLEIRLQDGDADDLDLSPLEKDFEITGRSQGSQISIINGSMTKEVTWALQLWPRHEGAITLPPLCCGSDCSQPIRIQVDASGAATDEAAPVLLEMDALPATALVQEQLLVRVRLLTRLPVRQASLSALQTEGVDVEVVKLGDDVKSVSYRDGQRYEVFERSYALFPQGSGTLTIAPLQLDLETVADRFARFDPFASRGQRLRRHTEAVTVTILPPSDRQHPWLVARGLRLSDDWQQQPPILRVGEPATRTLTLRGAGVRVAALPELSLPLPAGLKSYPDQPVRSELPGPGGVSGVVEQKVAVVPLQAGALVFPAYSLFWWDVEGGQWREEQIPALSVEVLPAERSAAVAVPPPVATPPAVAPSPSAMPQAPVAPAETPVSGQPEPAGLLWPVVAGFCALGWLLTALLWWRVRHRRPAAESVLRPIGAPALASAEARTEARKAVIQSARRHEMRQTRQALQHWAQALYPHSPRPLEALLEQADAPLAAAIRQLDQALYAATPTAWDGTALADAVAGWTAPRTEAAAQLPPFYPLN